MKHHFVTIGILLLIAALSPAVSLAQIDFSVNDFGRVRYYDEAGIRQLDRVSINLGVSESNVYHYYDLGGVKPVTNGPVTATLADSEYVCTISYDTGAVAMKVDVMHHVYYWQEKDYLIVNFRVYNHTDAALDGYVSFQMLPRLADAYGSEFCDYDARTQTGYAYKEGNYGGIKLLSQDALSYRSVFYSDYSDGSSYPDSLQWANMTAAENTEFPFNSTSDGSANYLNAGMIHLAAGDSTDYFLAIGYTGTLEDLQAMMEDAQHVYYNTFVSEQSMIDFSVNDFGRVRYYDEAGIRQLDRVSINLGVSESNVYHYYDIGGVKPVTNEPVTATLADSEYVCTISYDTGEVALDVEVKHHIYFWENKDYFIVNFRVLNNTDAAVNGYISFQMMPRLLDSYGSEFCNFDTRTQTGYAYKEGAFGGMKILSQDALSFRSIFYSDYSAGSTYPDSVQWANMTAAENTEFPFNSTSDGSANYLNAGMMELAAGDSTDYFVAVAFNSDLEKLRGSMTEAQLLYNQLFNPTGLPEFTDTAVPSEFQLGYNYPNPFNPTTKIDFSIRKTADVELSVYSIQGQLVKTLVKKQLNPGTYTAAWNGQNALGQRVASGVYIYALRANDRFISRKMVLLK